MKKIVILYLVIFPLLTFSQVAITFSDEFYLENFPEYDNWEYDSQSFFVLPLSINDYIPIESYQFNILYNPQVVQLEEEMIAAINTNDVTSSYEVLDAVSGQQGSISVEVFEVSANQNIATVTYSHTEAISENQFDNAYAILVYLPFKKVDACSKAPLPISFTDGNIDGQYANPNQTNAFIVNESLSVESGNIITQNAFVNFNILSADVTQNGSILESTIEGGTPPYTFEWTDKMDEVLSTDSFFAPGQTGDYLFYVYDQNNCNSILYVSYDQAASINEASAFSIYPNPAQNFIEVSSTFFKTYQLFNTKGQVVDKGLINTIKLIPRNEFLSGVYFLELNNETEKIVKKIVFE